MNQPDFQFYQMVLYLPPQACTEYENIFELEDGDILHLVNKA